MSFDLRPPSSIFALVLALSGCTDASVADNGADNGSDGNGAAQANDVYATYGVHNPPSDSPCAAPNCIYVRGPGEPADPLYPPYWQSRWTMYRVFQNYEHAMPPYDGRPPAPL